MKKTMKMLRISTGSGWRALGYIVIARRHNGYRINASASKEHVIMRLLGQPLVWNDGETCVAGYLVSIERAARKPDIDLIFEPDRRFIDFRDFPI